MSFMAAECRSKSAILDNWEELLQETGFSPNNIKKVLGDQLDDNPIKGEKKMNKEKSLEEFQMDLELQKKRVGEKIDPILQSYYEFKINKKELIEKLAEAFYSLEKEEVP